MWLFLLLNGVLFPAEHDPSLVSDSPAGSIASSNLSRATTMGGGRGSSGASVERLLYKALRALAETVGGRHQNAGGWLRLAAAAAYVGLLMAGNALMVAALVWLLLLLGTSWGKEKRLVTHLTCHACLLQVLGGREELVEQLGAVLWPQLAAGYITAKLKPMQPQSDAEVSMKLASAHEPCSVHGHVVRLVLWRIVPASRPRGASADAPCRCCTFVQVELYSRRSALGGKLEQKAVKLRLLRGDKEGPITRYIQHTLNRFLNLRRNR